MFDSNAIKSLISQKIADAVVTVESPDNVHFTAVVKSPAFTGKSAIDQHRMVYAALEGKVGNQIHALSIETQSVDL
jgi:acid stress-induced BolA-like protein IbaG/YrbA